MTLCWWRKTPSSPKPGRCSRTYHRRNDCIRRIGFQPVPNRSEAAHSLVKLGVRTIRLKNHCRIGFRDRQDACPTASIRLNGSRGNRWGETPPSPDQTFGSLSENGSRRREDADFRTSCGAKVRLVISAATRSRHFQTPLRFRVFSSLSRAQLLFKTQAALGSGSVPCCSFVVRDPASPMRRAALYSL